MKLVLVIGIILSIISCEENLLDEMKKYLRLSYSAYCPPKEITNWSCYWCKTVPDFKLLWTSGETDLHNLVFVGILNEDELVIGFRGSQWFSRGVSSIMNWIHDFEFVHRTWAGDPSKKSQVHSGFYKCYEDVMKYLHDKIEVYVKEHPKLTKIRVTGHSLGAAISGLFGLGLVERFAEGENPNEAIQRMHEAKNIRILTYGQPRLGNEHFFDYFHSKIPKENYRRVVNHRDMITSVPKEFQGYHHLATEYYFIDGEHYTKCNGSGEDEKCGLSHNRWSTDDHETYLGLSFKNGYDDDCV